MTRKELRAWCKAHGGMIDRSGGGMHDIFVRESHLMLHYDPDHDPVDWVRIEVPKSDFRLSLVGQLRNPDTTELAKVVEQLMALQAEWSS